MIDTNLYIDATRSPAASEALEGFSLRMVGRLYLHSVVAQELLAGATLPALARKTHSSLIAPFEALGRVITPTHRAWKRAGEIVAALVRAGRLSPGGFGRGFINDCLLAASAREHGFVLVTRNARDFGLIQSVEPIDFGGPWPDGS